MRRKWFRCFRLPSGILAALFLSGCASVDEWPVFEPDYEKVLAEEAGRERPLPAPPFRWEDEIPRQPSGGGDGAFALTLEDAVFLSLRYNPALRISRLETEIADAFALAERGIFDPELYADFEWGEENVAETARATGEQFSSTGNSTLGRTGLLQRSPTGGEVDLSVEQTRDISNRTPEQQRARIGLTVTQSLLRGFGPVVNLATIRRAEIGREISRYEFKGFLESLVAEVETAYWHYALAREEIAIFERSLEVARRQREVIEEQIAAGALPSNDGAAVRAEEALREQDLIDARSELEARRLRLARLILPDGGRWPGETVVAATEPDIVREPVADPGDRVRLAVSLRPDLHEARLRLDQDRLTVIRSRNGLLPRLEVFLAYGKTGFATTFSDSFRNLDGDTFDFTAGAAFRMPVGNRAARGDHRIAMATRDQAAESVRNLERLIREDVLLALNEVERSRRQIDATAVTLEAQQQSAEAEKERLQVGEGTSLDLALAQRDLLAAEIARVRSVIDYRIALVDLYLAEGSLVERRGIDPPE